MDPVTRDQIRIESRDGYRAAYAGNTRLTEKADASLDDEKLLEKAWKEAQTRKLDRPKPEA